MIETIIRNFTFDRLLYILKKSWAYIALLAFIGAFLGGVYAQSKKQVAYRAEVSFYLYSKGDYTVDSNAYVNSGEFSYAKSLIESYAMILKSSAVLQKVIDLSGVYYTVSQVKGKISFQPIVNTSMFYVYVTDSDPYVAMNIANTVAEVAQADIAQIVKSGGVSVVDYATLPSSPYTSTNLVKYVAFGGAGGFLVSAFVAFFLGLIDSTVRKKKELETTFDIPVVGEVPYISKKNKKQKNGILLDKDSPFALTEAYNELCTNLLYTAKGNACPVYVVTSAMQNEGKSVNSINIAKNFAIWGKKTLLIDADMRNPSVSKYTGNDESNGLSQYLAALNDKVNFVEIEDNLSVLFAGKQPPNPMELLASKRLQKLMETAKEQYDFIIIDAPPVGIVSDAMLLSDYITGYLLIIREDNTKITDEMDVVKKLANGNSNVSGFVYNCKQAKASRYGKNYKYGYYGKQ